MSDTATADAPVAPEATPAPAPARPVPDGPEPGQRSTGGRPRRAEDGPAPALNRQSAQDILRQAYGRQAEMAEQRDGRDAPELEPESPRERERPAPPPPAPDGARQRGPDGRFLPREADREVDGEAPTAVQEASTPAPPRERAPAPPAARATSAPAPEAPPSPAPAEDGTAPAEEAAPAADFRSASWQRAFQAQPTLRRTAARIQGDPNLNPSQKAERLAERLHEALQQADAAEWDAQQMRRLRDERPEEYINQLRAREAEQAASDELGVRISRMIAEAFEVPADDPDYLLAGPQEGDDREAGLARFVDFMATKSPVLERRSAEGLKAQAERYERQIADLKAQHKVDLEAARERGRASGRGPFRSNGPAPRSTGSGVVPVGQDGGESARQGPKGPSLENVRGAIALGYQSREPAT